MELVIKAGRSGFSRAWFFLLEALAICAVLVGGDVQPVHGQQAATLRRIAVSSDNQNLDVQITASRPVTPRTQFVTDPDRLIVDFPGLRPDAGLRKIAINRGKLRDVRVGLLSANPPITRVVMDLVAPPEFRVLPLANAVIVRLRNESASRAASESAPEPARVVPTTDPAPPAAVTPVAATSVEVIPPIEQPSERSWAHWIMPILVTTSVLAMLITALVVRIQNRLHRRGT